jgi:hypothetical protein
MPLLPLLVTPSANRRVGDGRLPRPTSLLVMAIARSVAWRCPLLGRVAAAQPPRVGGLRNQLTKSKGLGFLGVGHHFGEDVPPRLPSAPSSLARSWGARDEGAEGKGDRGERIETEVAGAAPFSSPWRSSPSFRSIPSLKHQSVRRRRISRSSIPARIG